MAYLITSFESSTKIQIEIDRKDYLSKPLEEQGRIGLRFLESDLQKTKALDLAGYIMRNQLTQIQVHQSKLCRPLTTAEIDSYLAGHIPPEIYDQTTDDKLRQAEIYIKTEKNT